MSYIKKFMAARLEEPVRPELINRMFSSIEEEFKLISKGISEVHDFFATGVLTIKGLNIVCNNNEVICHDDNVIFN